MGKHDRNTSEKIRKHVFVEKAPVLAAAAAAGAGWFISLLIGSFINIPICSAVSSYPRDGAVGFVIGAVLVMLAYKWWFRPEFEGQAIGGRPAKGFLYGLVIIVYFTVSTLCSDKGDLVFRMPTALAFGTAITAGVGEELCFRGLFLSTMMRQWRDDYKKMMIAVVLSGSVFGVVHITNIFSGADALVSIAQSIGAVGLGIFFAALYLRSGNILVPMFYHTFNNILAYATNAGIGESGIISDGLDFGHTADAVLCLLLMLYGLWLIRPAVFGEIRETWDKKWGNA